MSAGTASEFSDAYIVQYCFTPANFAALGAIDALQVPERKVSFWDLTYSDLSLAAVVLEDGVF